MAAAKKRYLPSRCYDDGPLRGADGTPLWHFYLSWLGGTLYPLWVPSFFGSAFNIFLMRQFFMTLPDELGEAARIDGCSEWGISGASSCRSAAGARGGRALSLSLRVERLFGPPALPDAQAHLHPRSRTTAITKAKTAAFNGSYLMAASAVLVVPIIVLFFFTQKTFVRGIATTGVKG